MPSFDSTDRTTLVYDDVGAGPAVALLHGYAANAQINWVRPGIAGALTGAGFRVLAPDLRGHGRSGAPHQVEAYAAGRLVEDVAGLLDAAGVEAAVLVGYSLGSRVAMLAAPGEPRVTAVVLGGVGEASLGGVTAEVAGRIASAMEAGRAADVEDRSARAFRSFADATRSDRVALAAVQRALATWPAADPAAVTVPTLVVA
ncbi:MAG: alpha/beta fold hydrolase, partial [Acidimicrobiales bacterium]